MDFYMAKNIRKAVLLLAMLSVIVGMFTACSNKKSDDGRTTFTVGFDAEFPPYGYKDDSGEYVGFDLDLAQEVCERNGWNLVKQPIDWDSKDMELSSGSIDCIWNGFTLNGREREYTWSKAYIDNSQVVIVKSGSGIKKLEDLKGKVVIVQADSSALAAFTGEDATEENLALAARRGKQRFLGWGITAKEREEYKERLGSLGLGLEDRMTSKVGLLSGGQRQAVTLLMASLRKPKLLLLDEHTAALDPKTAKKVLELTEEIVAKDNLTTLMITHNMKDAIRLGNRLIMMHEGKVIYDISGEEKKNLKVADLLAKFEEVSGDELANDRMILS